MTMCKHGIGASYCALCQHKRVLPELEPIGYDCVTAFKTAEYQRNMQCNGLEIRRARDGRYTERAI